MDTQQTLIEKIEVKRGGYAQYFIYLLLIMMLSMVNSVIKIPPPYLYYMYMVAGLVLVMGMNSIQEFVFRSPVLTATKEGLWVKRLGQLPWNEVKEIRVQKISRFGFVGDRVNVSTDTDLVIETNNGRGVTYWGAFLNTDTTELCAELNKYLHTYASHPTKG